MGGQVYDTWTGAEVVRDLSEISGSFRLELRDAARHTAFAWADVMGARAMVTEGLEAEVAIDGQPVLKGWVDDIAPACRGGEVSVSVCGRDKTADLIDCAATVEGPWEFKRQTLDQIVAAIVKPFGLAVRADVDMGEPLDRLVLEPGETAMSAIEKGARQRQVLITSDGLGAVVLTRSGKARAPADLMFPGGNAVESSGCVSLRERHSAYYVVAQAERAGGRRRKTVKLDVTAEPLGAGGGGGAAPTDELAGVKIIGTAKDAAVTRYRPLVAMARTQLTAKAAQDQADWMARVARASALKLEHVVRDYGAGGRLWRPNELALVDDAFQGVNRDLLVAGLVFSYGDQGARTHLRLTGPEAFDVEPEGPRSKNHPRTKALDGTAHEL